MAWRVVLEPQDGSQPSVLDVRRNMRDALSMAKDIAKLHRYAGEHRPKVHVVRTESSDQLQTYAHGTKATREQPELAAAGQDVVILAPTATLHANAPSPTPRRRPSWNPTPTAPGTSPSILVPPVLKPRH